MEDLTEFDDEFVRGLLKGSSRTIPNADFENQMMSRVHAAVTYKQEVSTKLVLSLKFFIGGISLGVLMLILLLFGEAVITSSKTPLIVLLFVLGVIGILNIGNYRRLIHQYSV